MEKDKRHDFTHVEYKTSNKNELTKQIETQQDGGAQRGGVQGGQSG